MELVIRPAAELAVLAADAVEAALGSRPDPVLGLATGSSPLAAYDELVRRHREAGLSFARCRAVTLDEYVGLPRDHPARYANVIRRDLTSRVDLDDARVHGPDANADDLPAACAAYERLIDSLGGVDVQVLGIGSDGHIGFNEPGSSLGSLTRLKTLTGRTRADNARFFGDDPAAVPQHCLTQGLATISRARHVVLLATGRGKAEAVHQLAEGPVSAMWPASVLQLHPHVTALVDDAAASRLRLADYYRDTYAAKPSWQGL